MAKVEKQVGWKFEGAEVISSTGYSKKIFINTQSDVRMYNKEERRKGWDEENKPDKIFDLEVQVGGTWCWEEGKLPTKFEVVQIERMNGKIISTTFIEPQPLFGEVDIPDEEAEQDA